MTLYEFMTLDEFNSFLGDKFKLFALIHSGSIQGDDMDKFVIEAEDWCKFIQGEIDELEEEIGLYKKMSKLQRLHTLKKEFDDYAEHIEESMTYMIDSGFTHDCLGDLVMKCLTEFRTLNFEGKKTIILYASVMQYHSEVDEEKERLTDEEYLQECDKNLNIIQLIKKLSLNYIRMQILSYAVKKFNSS